VLRRHGVDLAVRAIEHVDADAAVLGGGKTHFAPRDQVDRGVVLEHVDVGMEREGGEQRAFDFTPGHVLGVEDAALGMAALLAKIELLAVAGFALGERHAQLDQFLHPRRAFLDDAAHHVLVA
jgi:hypothetical protein